MICYKTWRAVLSTSTNNSMMIARCSNDATASTKKVWTYYQLGLKPQEGKQK